MLTSPPDVLKKTAKVVQAKRLHGIDKHKRDLIIYFLWNKGLAEI